MIKNHKKISPEAFCHKEFWFSLYNYAVKLTRDGTGRSDSNDDKKQQGRE